MPTIQGTDDFDHGFDVPADYDAVFGSPASVTSPVYLNRPASLEIVTTGANVGVRKNYSASPTRMWVGFAFQHAGASASASVSIWNCFASASSSAGQLWLDVNAKLRAGSSGVLGSDGPIIPINEWHWVEIIFNVVGATHTCFLRVEGVDQPSAAAAKSADVGAYGQFLSSSGNPTGVTFRTGYWHWGSATSDDDWLGEPQLESAAFFLPSNRRGS